MEGRIVKALSGFYDVKASDGRTYTCKGRGLFRNQNISPIVGDFVHFDQINDEEGYITKIAPRKNELQRPPISNVSKALIVCSIVQPKFSPALLDRFLMILESKEIQPMIVFSKADLASVQEREKMEIYKANYEGIGYPVVYFSKADDTIDQAIIDFIHLDVTVVIGQTGVGKSTLLNQLNPTFNLATGEISKSLGRGKHTTRHVELHDVNGGLIADTPGFSSIDFHHIKAEEVDQYFIELKEAASYCKFRTCMHINEPHCGVKRAVEEGKILPFRYEHYRLFLEEIQSRKPRY